MGLRIIIDREGDRVRDHAQRALLAQQRAQNDTRHAADVRPHGIAIHRAHYPDTCSECGATYWSTDLYASHLYCPGAPPKQRAGF